MNTLKLTRKTGTIGTILIPDGFTSEHCRLVFSGGECALFIHGNLHNRSSNPKSIEVAFNEYFGHRGVSIDCRSFSVCM